MKTAIALTFSTMVATTIGQSLSGIDSLATCGQNCVTSMISKATELGCDASDYGCICVEPDFSYGVRDCSREACGNENEASSAQTWARDWCAGWGVAVTSNGAAIVPSSTGSATATESTDDNTTTTTTTESSSDSSSSTASSTVITAPGVTSSFTTTISSGSITLTSTGVLTAPGFTSTVPPAPSDDGNNDDNNDGNNEDNDNPAPRATAAPLGILAAAGIAVFLL